MIFSEAMKLLEEGKKVRRTTWFEGEFLWKVDDRLETQDGTEWNYKIDGEWEEYIEEGKIKEGKIEELKSMKGESVIFADDVVKIADKLNEVIRYINSKG